MCQLFVNDHDHNDDDDDDDEIIRRAARKPTVTNHFTILLHEETNDVGTQYENYIESCQ